jgi:hypothetical protein
MILYPLGGPPNELPNEQSRPLPAWEAVERQQRRQASEWYLVAQPDHAALAGDLAARIKSPLFPPLSREVISAISLHDEGWAIFDNGEPIIGKHGRPLSFLEVQPTDFLQAWTGSIDRAEQDSGIGGIVVSEHFCRLGRSALERNLPAEDAHKVTAFLDKEDIRQNRLARSHAHSREEIEGLTDILQFCDLLSLYVCCGSMESVEFPQKFSGQSLRLIRRADSSSMNPPIFGKGASLAVSARKYPQQGSIAIPILLH